MTNADLRARVHAATAASYETGADWLRQLGDERDLPMPAEQLVRVIHALIEGLVLQRILTPDLCPDDVFFAAFAALANPARAAPSTRRGMSRRRPRQPPGVG